MSDRKPLAEWGLSGQSPDLPVLVVDDEPTVRLVLSSILQAHGIAVQLAESAEQGLQMLEDKPYLMVLTDIMMPGLSGLDFLVRARVNHPDIPIVMMTGYPTLERVVEALRGGATDFLIKPVHSAHLHRTVERALSTRRQNETEAEVQSFSSTRMSVTIPNLRRLLPGLVDFICDRSMLAEYYPPDVTLQIRMALHEAMSNAWKHGNLEDPSRRIQVDVSIDARAFEVTVQDEGAGFDYSQPRDPLAVNLLEETSGRGLFLIRCYMDEVEHRAGGSCIFMRKMHPKAATAPSLEPLRAEAMR